MKLRIEKEVVVITPTIGNPVVSKAIESVREQTYKNLKHLVVVDGPEHLPKAIEVVGRYFDCNTIVSVSPENTGANGFNGQRIYAAYPHLVNADYIFFLDQDNWYEPDHVRTLVDLIEEENLHWAHSLRKIYKNEDEYVNDDNCESLGKWPIFFTHDNPQYLVDTSSFAFTKDFINKTSHLWHSGPWGEDRRYLNAVRDHSRWNTTGKHTLCYRLGGNPNSVKEDFFAEGNAVMRKIYGEKFPWIKE